MKGNGQCGSKKLNEYGGHSTIPSWLPWEHLRHLYIGLIKVVAQLRRSLLTTLLM
jgi:hypothetical protein